MADHKITFFPVGNGDTTLITLSDSANILIDCNITKDSEDEDIIERYDVKSYLLDVLKEDNDIHHLDTFILTHPDIDHCRGVSKHFYFGAPNKFSQKDMENEKIMIDEIWFAPRIFNEYKKDLNDDAKEFRKEAERRIKLYRDGDKSSSEPGNRIRVIGYSDNPDLEGLDEILSIPGNEVKEINGSVKNDFRFFLLAPIKDNTDDEYSDRNDCSIVLQAKFDVKKTSDAGIVLMGGDSTLKIYLEILNKNTLDDLSFDIFLAPHHCSWYFFSEEKYEENPEPNDRMVELISSGRDGCYIIASCKKIEDNDDNPPHYHAAELYKEAVGDANFVCTATYPDEDEPKPLIFTFTENGPVKEEPGKNSSKAVNIAVNNVVEKPKTYGY